MQTNRSSLTAVSGQSPYIKFLSTFSLMLMLMLSGLSFGQASITSATAVTDPLTSYVGTAPTIPANWTLSYTGGTSHNGTAQTTGTAGGWYGNANISFLGSGSASNGNATWRLQNNSGSTLTGFTLVFTAKMWKLGTNSPNVTVSYTSNATGTNPTSGALPNSLSSLTFNDATPNVATAGASMTQTVTGLSIASGQYIFVRFIHAGGSSSDNLGWDDLSFTPVLASATPALAATATLNETTLNNSTIALTLTNDTFANANPLALSNFTLNNAPAGVSVSNVAFNSATSATVTLAYNNTDFDATVSNLSVTVAKAELTTSATALTSNSMTVNAVNEAIATAPSALTGLGYAFGSSTSTSQSFNISSSNLKLPAGNITITGSTNYDVSTDNSLFSGSVTIPFTTATISSTPVYVRLKTGLAIGVYNSQSITISGGGASSSVTVSGSVTGVSPILTAASGATVDNPFVVTFSDDAAWRSSITNITVGGTPITAGYAITAGAITFTPSASVPAGLLQLSGTKSIVVNATGYNGATVSQVIGVGAAKKLIIFKQPAAPAINGGVLATQPELLIGDQYSNLTNDTGIPVSAAVGAGAWTLGGTSAVNSNNGTVVYSGLTATSAAAVSGATIAFSAPGLTGVTSTGFNIVAPAPINDNCSTATAITLDAAAVTGNVLNATQSLAATCAGTANDDVWYSFTTAGAGTYRITVVGSASFDAVVDVRSGACNGTNIFCADTTGAGGTETVTATGLLASTTYYIRVYDYFTGYPATPTFTIAVTSPPPTLSTNGTTTFSFGNQAPLTQSASQTFNLSGTSLAGAPGNITVTAPITDFQVSNDNSTWGATTTIAYTTGTLASTPVYVRFTPQSSGSQTGNMTFSGGGTSGNPTIALSGTGVMPAPVATAATNIAATSFDANWGAVPGASTGYLLDVSTSSTFGTIGSATVTEGFESGLTGSYQTGNVTLGTGIWSVTNVLAGTTGTNSGTRSAQLQSATGSELISPSYNHGISTLTFWVTSSTAVGAVQVNYSTDGGTTWLAATGSPFTGLGTSKVQKTINLNTTTPTIFQILRTAATIYVDDIIINYGSTVPSFVTGYNAMPIAGQSTVTSSVTGLTADTTYYYRLRATDGTPSANSNVITVNPASRGGSVSADQTICSGTQPATLTLAGNNGTVVKWQKSSDTAFTSPIDIAITANNLTGTDIGNLTATAYFRAVVQSFANPTANSTFAAITVTPSPTYGNLQSPASGSICQTSTLDAYGQVYQVDVTEAPGAGSGITAQFGYSTTNTDPSTWTNWSDAGFNVQVGSNDEYKYTFTPPSTGTYYYTFRYRQGSCNWVYGGYSGAGGGFWNGTTNVNGSLLVSATVVSGTASADQTLCYGTSPADLTLTGSTGSIQWQTSTDNINFDNISGQTSSVLTGSSIGNLTQTTYFRAVVTSGNCPSVNSNTVVISVRSAISDANLQYPGNTDLCEGANFTAYGRVYQAGVTPGAGSGIDLTVEFGYSTSDTNPAGWADWSSATYNTDNGNKDEYQYTFTPPSAGTYYYTFRYKTGNCNWVYGGYTSSGGGFWDGTNNVSGVVNVSPTVTSGTVSGAASVFLGNTTTFSSNGTSNGTWSSANAAIASVDATTGIVTGNALGTTQITYTVNSGCGSPVSSSATITVTDVTTWTGTSGAGSWNHGSPTSAIKAAIEGSYDTSVDGNFSAFSLVVDPTGSLVIAENNVVTLQNQLTNNGIVTIESDGNLIQVTNSSANSGEITVKRLIAVKDNKQYNYLISPTIGTNLKTNIYGTGKSAPFTLSYNETNNTFNNSNGGYIKGRGLAVKEPASGGGTATFKGVPMNEAFSFALANTNVGTGTTLGYNMTGNPYPSNIDLDKLYNLGTNSSNISPTFYFWDNTVNTAAAQGGTGYNGAAYAVFNAEAGSAGTGLAAGTLSGNVNGSKVPTRIVKTGQGFIVQSIEKVNKTLEFDNSIRTAEANPVFFGKGEKVQDDRFWLRLSAPTNVTTQLAIVYFKGGDNAFAKDDSKVNGLPSDVLYSVIGDQKALINGRAPFVNTDQIPLGTNSFVAGTFTFSLGNKEGVFANGQNIYLKDQLTGIITNLSQGSYSFTNTAGEQTGRFEILYQPEIVLVTDSTTKSGVEVYRDANDFVVRSSQKELKQIEVYDASGRLIYTVRSNSKQVRIDSEPMANGIYIIKARFKDDSMVSVKVRK